VRAWAVVAFFAAWRRFAVAALGLVNCMRLQQLMQIRACSRLLGTNYRPLGRFGPVFLLFVGVDRPKTGPARAGCDAHVVLHAVVCLESGQMLRGSASLSCAT